MTHTPRHAAPTQGARITPRMGQALAMAALTLGIAVTAACQAGNTPPRSAPHVVPIVTVTTTATPDVVTTPDVTATPDVVADDDTEPPLAVVTETVRQTVTHTPHDVVAEGSAALDAAVSADVARSAAGGYAAPPVTALPACRDEDGNGDSGPYPCLWDGATMGNGTGDSYVVNGPDDF